MHARDFNCRTRYSNKR